MKGLMAPTDQFIDRGAGHIWALIQRQKDISFYTHTKHKKGDPKNTDMSMY